MFMFVYEHVWIHVESRSAFLGALSILILKESLTEPNAQLDLLAIKFQRSFCPGITVTVTTLFFYMDARSSWCSTSILLGQLFPHRQKCDIFAFVP